jgi:hypothetical protein
MRKYDLSKCLISGADLGLLQDYKLFFQDFPKTCENCSNGTGLQCACKAGYFLCSTECQRATRTVHKSDCNYLRNLSGRVNTSIPDIIPALGAVCSMFATTMPLEQAREETLLAYEGIRDTVDADLVVSCMFLSVHGHILDIPMESYDTDIVKRRNERYTTKCIKRSLPVPGLPGMRVVSRDYSDIPTSDLHVHDVCRTLITGKDLGFLKNPKLLLGKFKQTCTCGSPSEIFCECVSGFVTCGKHCQAAHSSDCKILSNMASQAKCKYVPGMLCLAAAYGVLLPHREDAWQYIITRYASLDQIMDQLFPYVIFVDAYHTATGKTLSVGDAQTIKEWYVNVAMMQINQLLA